MAYQSLYRKYRPQNFTEVAGQAHVVEILKMSIKKDIISHAYLFCGPRATGKTSIAKIFATAINCTGEGDKPCGHCANCLSALEQSHPDIVEIDAASNNGVDEIRSLIERVKYTPILGRKKIYIIDEVHMLSQSSFNALLKTLEEPPEHIVFILATTEIHKVLPTIISRCQRFDFLRLTEKEITNRLKVILEREQAEYEEGVPELIASLSEGGLRNALTLLEQAIIVANPKITCEQIYRSFKMILPEEKLALFNALLEDNMSNLLAIIQEFNAKSVNQQRLLYDLLANLKDAYIANAINSQEYSDPNQKGVIDYIQKAFSMRTIQELIDKILDSIDKMRFNTGQDLYFEILMMDAYNLVHKNKKPIYEARKLEFIEPEEEIEEVSEEEKFPVEEETTENQEEITLEEPTVEAAIEIEPIETKVEEKIEEYFETEELSLDIESLIQLMVTADKSLRMQDEARFSNVKAYVTDLEWAKASKLLVGSSLVLSGTQFIVVALPYDYQVNEVMERSNRRLMEDFSNLIFGKTKHILAVTEKMFRDGISLFREKTQESSLPQAVGDEFFKQFEASTVEEHPEIRDESIELIKNLFGETVQFEK